MAHVLLLYDLSADYLERRGAFRERHLRLGWEASERGDLLLGGAYGDPVEGAALLFTDAAAAEAFAHADPYVAEGLVTRWRVLPWTTVIGEGAATPVRP